VSGGKILVQETIVKKQDRVLTTRKLTLTCVFGALYAILVIVFASTSVLPIQIRFADALLPLAILFGWPAALGVAIGAFIGNFGADTLLGSFSSAQLGTDLLGGSLANLIAGLLAWRIGRMNWQYRNRRISWIIATIVETLVVGVIVGSYLSWIFGVPILFQIGLIIAGSIISINIIGYAILRILGQPRTLANLNRQGLVSERSEHSSLQARQ
jgi:hypothetical protein